MAHAAIMTVHQVSLKGREVVLEDGTTIVVRAEAEDGVAVTVLAEDGDGREVGRVRLERPAGHGAASLSVRTAPDMRRRGIARVALLEAMPWAAVHDVPFVVGEVPTTDAPTRSFLAGCGLVVAWRSFGDLAKFAIFVPGRVHTASLSRPGESLTRALMALESGASEPEAEGVYDRLAACVRRHPSTFAA